MDAISKIETEVSVFASLAMRSVADGEVEKRHDGGFQQSGKRCVFLTARDAFAPGSASDRVGRSRLA